MKPFPRHPLSPERERSSQTSSFQIIGAVESADKEPAVCSELEQTVPAGCLDKPPRFGVRTQRLSPGSSLCWGTFGPPKMARLAASTPHPQKNAAHKGWELQQEESSRP